MSKEELEKRSLIRRSKKSLKVARTQSDQHRGPIRKQGKYPTTSLPPLQQHIIQKTSMKLNAQGKLIPFHSDEKAMDDERRVTQLMLNYEPPPSPPLPPLRFIRMRRLQHDMKGDSYPTMPCQSNTMIKKNNEEESNDRGVNNSNLNYPEPVRNRNDEKRVTYVGSPQKFNLKESDLNLLKKVNRKKLNKRRSDIKIEQDLKLFWRCDELSKCDIVRHEMKLAEIGLTSLSILKQCSDRDLIKGGLRPVSVPFQYIYKLDCIILIISYTTYMYLRLKYVTT